MSISALINPANFGYFQTSNDGVSWTNSSYTTIGSEYTVLFGVVPMGNQYRLFNCTMYDTGANTNLTELR